MAKKQTRRSISVSRTTYERLKSFCETNHISMSQLVETRVNDFLGTSDFVAVSPVGAPAVASSAVLHAPVGHGGQGGHVALAPRPVMPRPIASTSAPVRPESRSAMSSSVSASASVSGAVASSASGASSAVPASPATLNPSAPMTSAAARYAVEPPLPIIKPRQETAAPKPAEKRPDQIFTF
jgi:hypothetical protein